MRQKYYSIKKLDELDCEYNIILGERSNGKSFAVKHLALKEALSDDNKKFIYLRRWDLELKGGLVEQYFADANVELLTDGESNCITAYRGGIYTGFMDDNHKVTRQKLIGYARALSMESHYTSGVYADVSNVIFEEFISRQTYLGKEPYKLQQFISTVARRRKIQVWMIGNTISRVCPYFVEWELRNIPRQKQGTIEIYEHGTDQIDDDGNPIKIKIAVEYAENSGNNSKMFFGSTSKMVTSGAWQSGEKPHLPKRVECYEKMWEIVVKCEGFVFYCRFLMDKETGDPVWYVEPKTTPVKPYTRIVSDTFDIDQHATIGFVPMSKNEEMAFSYIKNGKITYCDNLTGADFESCLAAISTKSGRYA